MYRLDRGTLSSFTGVKLSRSGRTDINMVRQVELALKGSTVIAGDDMGHLKMWKFVERTRELRELSPLKFDNGRPIHRMTSFALICSSDIKVARLLKVLYEVFQRLTIVHLSTRADCGDELRRCLYCRLYVGFLAASPTLKVWLNPPFNEIKSLSQSRDMKRNASRSVLVAVFLIFGVITLMLSHHLQSPAPSSKLIRFDEGKARLASYLRSVWPVREELDTGSTAVPDSPVQVGLNSSIDEEEEEFDC